MPVPAADFYRRLLRVFRDSDYDFTYQETLTTLPPADKERVERFVAEDKPLDDVARDFVTGISSGVREHLQHLVGVDVALVSAAGVELMTPDLAPTETHVEGLSGRKHFDWLRDRYTMVPGFLYRLKDFFKGHFAAHNVVVSRRGML